MHALQFSIASLSEGSIAVDAVVSEETVRPVNAASLQLGPVRVQGVLDELGGEVLFRGTVSGVFRNTCDRCLDPMEAPFSVEVTWLFEEGELPEAEGGVIDIDPTDDEMPRIGALRGSELDLAPLAWEEIVLVVPSKYLCVDDCAGLCPGCGANLNREPCACPSDKVKEPKDNQGLAGLADMFPDLKPDKLEE